MAHSSTLHNRLTETTVLLRRGSRRPLWPGLVLALSAMGLLSGVGRSAPATEKVQTDWTAVENQSRSEPAATSSDQIGPLASSATEPALRASASCHDGMIEVRGEYCPVLAQFCTRFVDDKPERDRCAEFRPGSRCYGKTVPMHFCIDRYEYPNSQGATPKVGVTWEEAANLCKAEAKRLCKDTEWTLACEGDERRPYPYGDKRDKAACNIDQPYILPNDAAYASTLTREAEIARLDQREASGSRDRCVSPHGVFDMTGNVDEWVENLAGSNSEKPYVSGLKGGYWGPVRTRCRPMTVDHNKWHSGYQIGFRCCAEAST